MKFAGQTKRDTFGKSYAHQVVEVDGAATFLEIQSRRDHIKNHRSMGMRRNRHLHQSLPAKAEVEFRRREDIVQLDTQIQSLKKQSVGKDRKLQNERRRLETKRNRLYLNELKRVRRGQTRGLSNNTPKQTLFDYARKAMPERGMLADVLPTTVQLRSPTGREALFALETICSQELSVVYLPALAPMAKDSDLECICGHPMKGYVFPWKYYYLC